MCRKTKCILGSCTCGMNKPANCFLLCGIVILNLNEIIILQLKLVLKLQQMYINLF